MIIIYKHTNKINGKIYIGQTSQKLERRSRYNGSGYSNCKKFYRAIQKYGWENFTHEILLNCGDDNKYADFCEEWCIRAFDSVNNGYNILPGGQHGRRGIKLTEDHKLKISIANKGKKLSKERLEKLINSHFKYLSDEQKTSISKRMKEYHMTHENPFKGKKHSDKTKNIISIKRKQLIRENNSNKISVILIDITNGTSISYKCLKSIIDDHPDFKYDSLKSALHRNSIYKNKYIIKYNKEGHYDE